VVFQGLNHYIQKHLATGGLSLLLVLVLSACTNNININGAFSKNVVSSNDPTTTTDGSNTGAFTLSRVIKNTLKPDSVLDLIGDGSGALGTLCQSTDESGTSTSTSPTTCECSFEYSSPTRPNEHIFTSIIYHEQNMVRCSYSELPSDATTVNVSIHLTSADTYSTVVKFSFNGNGVVLDPSNPESFAQAYRYQCRDNPVIPYLFDSNVYDPIQSEDPHIAYPLNFYATNFGKALSVYANKSGEENVKYWNCPPILNPSLFLTGSILSSYYETHHLNLNVYSKAFLSGSKLIYPPSTGSFDRSTFYLAREQSGIFSVPVKAYTGPWTISTLGYGASPTSTGIGGLETCPDTSATIPTGYHWVKVWLFRADLLPRKYVTYGTSTSGKLLFQK
jgi:hypothetical protein